MLHNSIMFFGKFFAAWVVSVVLRSHIISLEQPYMWFFIVAVIVLAASFCAYSVSRKKNLVAAKNNMSAVEGFYPILNLGKFWHLVLFFVEIGLVLCLAYIGGSPFIYGQY